MAGAFKYDSLKAKMMPKNGYWFRALTKDRNGDKYQLDADKDGRSWTNEKRWAVVAYPAVYNVTGDSTFLVGEDGAVWKKDTRGQAVDAFPKDPAKAGWKKAN